MPINEIDFRKIAQFPIFEGLSSKELHELLSESRIRVFNHRETLFEIGDPASSFAIGIDGAFKLMKPSLKGDDFIMYFATPGDIIGALVMSSKKSSTFPITVKAIGCSRACVIPRSTFHRYWETNAKMLLRLNGLLYSRMGILQDDKVLSRAPLPQRIASFLLKLLERKGDCEDQMLPLPLTRQEIADHLGVTVESVIRVMSSWTQNGIVRSADRQIEILRVDQLIELLKETY